MGSRSLGEWGRRDRRASEDSEPLLAEGSSLLGRGSSAEHLRSGPMLCSAAFVVCSSQYEPPHPTLTTHLPNLPSHLSYPSRLSTAQNTSSTEAIGGHFTDSGCKGGPVIMHGQSCPGLLPSALVGAPFLQAPAWQRLALLIG